MISLKKQIQKYNLINEKDEQNNGFGIASENTVSDIVVKHKICPLINIQKDLLLKDIMVVMK